MSKLPRADKNLGQHFLRDKKVIGKITEDYADKCEAIIEIGPGPGILTASLAKLDKPFYVIEKDERFPDLLEEFISKDQITLTDALKVDLNKFVEEKGIKGKKIWLVSNLPYNVGVPLLMNFIRCPDIKNMTLMFQREVADKIVPFDTREGKAMNSLLALTRTYFDCELLCKVPAGAFSPPPKVDSAVLTCKRKDNSLIPLDDIDQFESFLRHLFSQKRKQVGSLLKSLAPQEKWQEALKKLELEQNRRAESFNLEQVQLLYVDIKR